MRALRRLAPAVRAASLAILALARPSPAAPQAGPNPWALPEGPLLGFVEIAGGPIRMGSDPSVDPMAFDNERWSAAEPRGTVEVPTFYIGAREVTVAQYRVFVEATGRPVGEGALDASPDFPVAFVSWPDALLYARWLEGELRASPAAPPPIRELLASGWRVSLPTEAEWEKAAKGSLEGAFPWGNAPAPGLANYGSNRRRAVGSIVCFGCAYGLSDMAGNVWEWTRSPYQPYPYTEEDDREDLEADALWVMRGGGYADNAQNIRTTVRGAADPGVRREFIGFRVVLSAP